MNMWIICPNCGDKFAVNMWSIKLLEESYNRNQQLKFICPPCGKKAVMKYWRKQNEDVV